MKLEFEINRWDLKNSYSLNLKRSLLITLIAFNFIFLLSPRFEINAPRIDTHAIVTIDVENIPATRQTRTTSPPPRPTIPVPTDDESVPENETIEETDLKYTTFFDDTKSNLPGMPQLRVTPPRPVAWVFPEFPESEKKNAVRGTVKLSIRVSEKGKVVEVVVIENTTNSSRCADAAIAAAYGSRFLPAREGSKAVSYWITQPYRFDSTN